jgi:hypothetical protein
MELPNYYVGLYLEAIWSLGSGDGFYHAEPRTGNGSGDGYEHWTGTPEIVFMTSTDGFPVHLLLSGGG